MKTIKQFFSLIIFLGVFVAFDGCEKEVYDMNEPGNLVPKTVTEDPLLPRLELNGSTFHAETMGDIENPIIIFLHGGPGSDYRALISQKGLENASRYPEERTVTSGGLSQLQDEFFCVFYDQRGGGLSQRFARGVMSFDLFVEDLNAIIDYYIQKKETETGILDPQVYLFAWSFGGTLATGYTNQYPEKVKDIVAFEPGPLSKEVWDYVKDNTTFVLSQIGKEWLEEYLLSHDHFTSDDHERADYQYMMNVSQADLSQPEFHADPNTPYWRSGALLIDDNLDFVMSDDFDITSNLSHFEGSFLFIGSENVLNELPEYANLQMQYYPVKELVEISGVGHTGPWEKPDEIATIIRNYFQ